MKCKIFFGLMLSFNFLLNAQIELPVFCEIGPKQGLPEGFVHAVICDHQGLIWIASYEGLFQYNGYKLNPIYSQGQADTTTLSSQRVFSLLEDSKYRIWVGTTQGVNLMDRITGKFTRFQNKAGKPNQVPDNHIHRIFEDSRKRIWISTSKGLALYDENKKQFQNLSLSDSGKFVAYTLFEVNNTIWLAGNSGFYILNENNRKLYKANINLSEITVKTGPFICSKVDENGEIWIGAQGGLFKLNTKKNQLVSAQFPDNNLDGIKVSGIVKIKNQLWLGTSVGLIFWDPNTNEIKQLGHSANNPLGLSTSHIQTLTEDRNGNLWMGTSLTAASFQTKYNPIHFYVPNSDKPVNHSENHMPRIYEDRNGHLWTWSAGSVKKSKGIGTPMEPVNNTPFSHFLECFLEVEIQGKTELLISYSSPGHGLYRFNKDKNSIEPYPINPTLDKMSMYSLATDRTNPDLLWIGTLRGVCVFNLRTKDTFWVRQNGQNLGIKNVIQRSDNRWFLITTRGYSIYDYNKRSEELYLYDSEKANIYHSGFVRCIAEGKNNSHWIATETGLSYYNGNTKRYKNYSGKNGIKGGNIIYALHVDKSGNCWVVTNSYLINVNAETGQFRYYSASDGVLTTFNRWSYCVTKNGTILFGGINGMIGFDPENIPENKNKPQLVLTDFQINNKRYWFGKLPENISEVSVGYEENAITFEYAALEYAAPEKNEYAHRLVGFDTGWIYSGTERRVTYTNLSPGTYYFEVKCTNSQGIWNENGIMKIKVVITPLYYQTFWFRGLMCLILAGIIYLFYRNKKQQRALEQQKEIAELNSLYKSKFLTNMSHEIRTPMNAIIGLNRLLLETPLNEKQKKYASAVQQSSENLLWIVNDILDQAKIESGKYTIIKKPFQLDVILKQIHNLLSVKAEDKKLEFNAHIASNVPLKLMGDPVRLYQILTNLIANAIKFTPKGSVSIHVESASSKGDLSVLTFLIKDTGIGIPNDKIQYIFESFKQLDSEDDHQVGTGLGLTIANELVQQMNGKIEVESVVNQGTTFTLTMPFEIDKSGGISVVSASKQIRSEKPIKILLVDDTRFNILLATELINEQFPRSQTHTAENGKIAWEKIQENEYDIVLMDVKMPIMDGIEASRLIRNSEIERIKNLPILGLTANAIPEQLKECFNAGMNDYLTKPVNATELFEKIDALTST